MQFLETVPIGSFCRARPYRLSKKAQLSVDYNKSTGPEEENHFPNCSLFCSLRTPTVRLPLWHALKACYVQWRKCVWSGSQPTDELEHYCSNWRHPVH